MTIQSFWNLKVTEAKVKTLIFIRTLWIFSISNSAALVERSFYHTDLASDFSDITSHQKKKILFTD